MALPGYDDARAPHAALRTAQAQHWAAQAVMTKMEAVGGQCLLQTQGVAQWACWANNKLGGPGT